MQRTALVILGLALLAASAPASAAVTPTRTRFAVPSANGHAAIVVDLDQQRRIVQFREHVYAAEEPVLDAGYQEVWNGSGFAAVHTRDVLFDSYFGLRSAAGSTWLPAQPIDADASGYVGLADEVPGGTGIVAIEQSWGDLHATTYAFAPIELDHAGFAMIVRVRNDGDAPAAVQAFSLHNFHLGYGRPQTSFDVGEDLASNGETLAIVDDGTRTIHERGFAGVVVARALAPASHFGLGPTTAPYDLVLAGDDLPDVDQPATANDAISAWQFDLGTLAAGDEAWAGVVFVHRGDPFAGDEVEGWIDEFVAGRDAAELFEDERSAWSQFHDQIVPPADLADDEAIALRQAAAALHMGQVREHEVYLREWLDQDGVARRTRLPEVTAPASLPASVTHRGQGAILASLPPGNWTYAWLRDGAYATMAMSVLGLHDHARAALRFYLEAESGRFADWSELADYDMPPYQPTLVRYEGFGVEETDFNDFGPNLEFDGFGLLLWALRGYVDTSGEMAFVADNWDVVAERVADPLLALVDPINGLVRADSSIWETHWNGRQRQWAFTSITAARGLCDAAVLADQLGDAARADAYRSAGVALQSAIADALVDDAGVLASNREELVGGDGYLDAAVLDAFALGVIDPHGPVADATIAALDAGLLSGASGLGWSRNDDRNDHGGGNDLSPWGSDYDSAEWVFTDLRGAIAVREAGDAARSDAILQWITDQTATNYLMFAETYDEDDGTYKFNTPMLGFGAGAYALALAHRGGLAIDPACDAWDGGGDTGSDGGSAGSDAGSGTAADGTAGTAAATDDGSTPTTDVSISASISDSGASGSEGGGQDGGGGCGCNATPAQPAIPLVLALFARRRRRRTPALRPAEEP